MLQLYHGDRSAWGASHRDLGDMSAWGAPHRDPGDRIRSAFHRDKIRVPGMLLTVILEIGVLIGCLILIGVLLPSGPDNLHGHRDISSRITSTITLTTITLTILCSSSAVYNDN